MAYAAVISLKQTINGLLNSSHTSLVPFTREILESAYSDTASLQQVLERLDKNEKLDDDLERQIRDCAYNLEDVLEIHELNAQDEKVRQQITFFAQTVKKMEIHVQELSTDENDKDDDVSSKIDFQHDVEMVGNYPDFNSLRDNLIFKMRPVDLCIFSFLGEKGSGTTAVANTIFQDLRKEGEKHFDCWAWVQMKMKPLSRNELKEVLISILAQVDDSEVLMLTDEDEEELCKYLYKRLEHRRYMIVLDDVCDVELVHYLKNWLPDQRNGSLVLFTTSILEVALLADDPIDHRAPQAYFSESFWLSLRALIFDRNHHLVTAELEEAGRKIVENCRALVIPFAKALLFLLKTDESVEQWSKIAADKDNEIFRVSDEIAERK